MGYRRLPTILEPAYLLNLATWSDRDRPMNLHADTEQGGVEVPIVGVLPTGSQVEINSFTQYPLETAGDQGDAIWAKVSLLSKS